MSTCRTRSPTPCRDAQLPVSSICQTALEQAVRDVTSLRATDQPPTPGGHLGLFNRFTPRAREALLTHAQNAARAVPHDSIGPEHVLIGILDEGQNLAIRVLESLDVAPAVLRAEIVGSLHETTQGAPDQLPFTPETKRALELTTKEAFALGHNYVGCEHLLLGVLALDKGIASQVLQRMGLELRMTRRAVVTALAGVVHAQQNLPARPVTSADAAQILERLEAIEEHLLDLGRSRSSGSPE